MSGIVRECPTAIGSTRLWAEMLGVGAGREWVPDSEGGERLVRVSTGPARYGWYLVGDTVVDADGSLYSGMYNGNPVWTVGDFFLFKAGGKWILSPSLAEPQAWTRTVIGVDGNGQRTETTRIYGDKWYEAESLRADSGGNLEFAAAGRDADAAPTKQTVSLGGPVWAVVGGGSGPAGEYDPLAGTSATRRVGLWTWQVDGGATWALNPADRTRMIDAETGAPVECPNGAWTVRRGDGGAWVAQLSYANARYEGDMDASWVGDAPEAQPEGDKPEIEWAGLAAVPDESPCYVYQPSRFL